jgi:hypothetical protein
VSYSQRAGAAVAAVLLTLGVTFALSACASPVTDETGADQEQTQQGQPDDNGQGDEGDTDGDSDPTQDTVRTGPIAEYGGPAYGDQGEAEVTESGDWCKTIQVFWGGSEPIPEGVSFTFDTAVPDQPGLEVVTDAEACGTRGATAPCLGLTFGADESGVACSVVVRPDDAFGDGTTISFEGTLSCPTADVCDAMAAREVDPGPPLVVNRPADS